MLKLKRRSSSKRRAGGSADTTGRDYEIVGEPALETMLADEVVRLTMASDGVTEADIREILQMAKSSEFQLGH